MALGSLLCLESDARKIQGRSGKYFFDVKEVFQIWKEGLLVVAWNWMVEHIMGL